MKTVKLTFTSLDGSYFSVNEFTYEVDITILSNNIAIMNDALGMPRLKYENELFHKGHTYIELTGIEVFDV